MCDDIPIVGDILGRPQPDIPKPPEPPDPAEERRRAKQKAALIKSKIKGKFGTEDTYETGPKGLGATPEKYKGKTQALGG